jgi:hypothetical protein
MMKYSFNRHPACAHAVRDVLRFTVAGAIPEKDLLSILASTVELKIGAPPATATPSGGPRRASSLSSSVSPPSSQSTHQQQDSNAAQVTRAVTELVAQATKLAASMDCRGFPALMDVASMLPVDTTALMGEMLRRLADEAGKLSPTETVAVVEILSTYPPAKGHVAITSLAFASSLRKEGFEADSVEKLLLSFAQLGHFTDDFYALADFAFSSRRGIQTFDALKMFLACLDKPKMVHHRMKAIVASAVQLLVPVLNDEELSHVRKELFRLGAEDRALQQRILNRQQTVKKDRRGTGGAFGKKQYDPVDELFVN